MNLELNADDLKPLREKISTSIRDLIIEGKLKPGERLTEPEMSSSLGISRTPLREAFLQLESEGFVLVQPRRGAIVSGINLRDAEETYTIKSSLEALATKLACSFITDDILDFLLRLNAQMEKISTSENKNYRRFLDLNAKFHQSLIEFSRNQKLIKLITTLRNQTLRYNYIYLSLLSHLDESVNEHYEILKALKNRDAESVEILIKKHGENARVALFEFLKNNSNLPKESHE
ncbi:MAG TPA: GntR family transcriptional regulator [Ignavibacteriaceae bacterium]|jgi:DNA-binding GntR family transcriptional regulator|nr:GntR family transcriptional regulator [Ignavibacteriaceae bacterium]HOJ17114.1 GntR family transcriptional regulator [Ignavibacteriaceae bacterium]HPO56965.1 GntR family transcriptional regulator [Ignavibacteriaceae bacterium]